MRTHQTRSIANIAVAASAAALLVGGSTAAVAGTTPAPAAAHGATATSFGGVTFGTATATAQHELTTLLGQPKRAPKATHLPAACGISRTEQFERFTAYYFRGKFVGYEYRGHAFAAPHDLRVGTSVATAKARAGKAFKTSYAQGGSWSLKTSSGKIGGYLDAVPPHANIATIDAGSLGCAGMAP